MEPERPIEKLLRAFAKKRREQADEPMELHSAMRQQLQKEIARRSAGRSGGGWFSNFFFGLRPRLAFAFCLIALVFVGIIFLPSLEHRKPKTLASVNASRDDMVPAQKTMSALAPPPVSAVAPSTEKSVFDDKQSAVSGSVAPAPVQPQAASGKIQPIVPPPETLKSEDLVKKPTVQAEPSVASAQTAPSNKEMSAFKSDRVAADSFANANVAGQGILNKDANNQPSRQIATPTASTFAANEDSRKKLIVQAPSAPPAEAAFFNNTGNNTAAVNVSQVFNRLETPVAHRRVSGATGASAPVLASFRMEQNGNSMRVVDADGSVYTGAVQFAQQQNTRAVPPKNAPSAAQMANAAGQSQAAQNYFFRVAGTNRNLNQNVIFSGNLIPITNGLYSANAAGFGGGGGAAPSGTIDLPVELLLSNSRISGKAVIGDQKEIEVNATPAP